MGDVIIRIGEREMRITHADFFERKKWEGLGVQADEQNIGLSLVRVTLLNLSSTEFSMTHVAWS